MTHESAVNGAPSIRASGSVVRRLIGCDRQDGRTFRADAKDVDAKLREKWAAVKGTYTTTDFGSFAGSKTRNALTWFGIRMAFFAVLLGVASWNHPSDAADCRNWNSEKFFRTITPMKFRACLVSGLDPIARIGAYQVTPLHVVAGLNHDPAVVDVLVEVGADPNARDKNEATPLHYAVWPNDNPAVISALIDRGADPNAQAQDGLTPLHIAAEHSSNPSVISALLEGKADPNIRADDGRTSLHIAAKHANNPKIVAALIDSGANPKARDKSGLTPRDYVQENAALKGTDVWWLLNVEP